MQSNRVYLIVAVIGFVAALLKCTNVLDNIHVATSWQTYEMEHWIGPHTVISITRSPITMDLNMDLSGFVTIDDQEYLESAKIYVGNDADDSNTIESEEWTCVCTASIVESGGVTTATFASTTVSALADAYAVYITDASGTYGNVVFSASSLDNEQP